MRFGMTFRINDLEMVIKARQRLGNPPGFVQHVVAQQTAASGGPLKRLQLEEAKPNARLGESGAVHTSPFSMMVNPDFGQY
jgi:hypothetical protein